MHFHSLWLLVAIGGAAAATLPNRKTSNIVKGAAFDRIAIIYFENQNYEKAQGDGRSDGKFFSIELILIVKS